MFFFFNDTATTEIYTLSLHDALPIYRTTDSYSSFVAGYLQRSVLAALGAGAWVFFLVGSSEPVYRENFGRSEEHTSELQSRLHLVCRLLLEKKKNDQKQLKVAETEIV